ncbi:MAG: multiprotein-bridging factor 1 family protein [Candidatus Calditenuis sp.]|jgi:putative transcription factor|nr:multiprotein-bridging factor 1 family protein [Candidatus Calditenuis sp.]
MQPRSAPQRKGGADRYAGVVERVERYEFVEDLGNVVRKAREARFLTREQLAEMVGEKVSTIRRIENNELKPSFELARKLEKVLKVKLLVEATDEVFERVVTRAQRRGLTIGDVLREQLKNEGVEV